MSGLASHSHYCHIKIISYFSLLSTLFNDINHFSYVLFIHTYLAPPTAHNQPYPHNIVHFYFYHLSSSLSCELFMNFIFIVSLFLNFFFKSFLQSSFCILAKRMSTGFLVQYAAFSVRCFAKQLEIYKIVTQMILHNPRSCNIRLHYIIF